MRRGFLSAVFGPRRRLELARGRACARNLSAFRCGAVLGSNGGRAKAIVLTRFGFCRCTLRIWTILIRVSQKIPVDGARRYLEVIEFQEVRYPLAADAPRT